MAGKKNYSVSIEVRHKGLIYGHAITEELRPTKAEVTQLLSELKTDGIIPANRCTDLITLDTENSQKHGIICHTNAQPTTTGGNSSCLKIFVSLNDYCMCDPKQCPKNIVNGNCTNEFIKKTIFKKLFENKQQR